MSLPFQPETNGFPQSASTIRALNKCLWVGTEEGSSTHVITSREIKMLGPKGSRKFGRRRVSGLKTHRKRSPKTHSGSLHFSFGEIVDTLFKKYLSQGWRAGSVVKCLPPKPKT